MTKNPIKNMPFGSIYERLNALNRKSFKEIFCFGSFATAFFVFADFIPLKIKWESVQTENWFFVTLLALVSAVILDFPMYIAGRKIREFKDKLTSRKEMLIIILLAITAFLVVYIPYVVFSLYTKNATFQEALPLDASTISFGNTKSSATNPQSVSAAAIFMIVLPCGTSISSMIFGLTTYHPLEERIYKKKKLKLFAQEHRCILKQALVEVDSHSEKMPMLVAREQDLYSNHLDTLRAREQIRIQAHHDALEDKLDVEGILKVTDSAFDQINKSNFSTEFAPEVIKYIKNC